MRSVPIKLFLGSPENWSSMNTPLKEVFAELERHFDVSITVKRDLGNLTFTGKFKQPLLSNVIETVCLSAGLEYTINKNSVIIQ